MDHPDHLAALRRDAPALLEAIRAAEPTTRVGGCPEWDAIDLAWHIGEVHDFWASIVRDRMAAPDTYVDPERPASPEEVLEFADARARLVVDTLESADPAEPVWTWTDRHDARWVLRRMAQETAVHRADAEALTVRPYRIDPALAADGIDEFLEYFVPAVDDAPPLPGSVHLHCEDTDGEWVVRPAPGAAVSVTREHAKGDAAIRGAANDLLLVLWRRLPLDAVEVIGDRAVAEAFLARTRTE